MRLSRLLVPIVLAVVVAPAIRAQTADQSDADNAIRAKLKSDLRNLVTSQEAYYASHNAYADVLGNLTFRPSSGTEVSLVATQNNAWAAVASDPAWPGKSCVIFINLAEKYRPKTLQEKRAGETNEEGRPLCDGDPKPEK
jgi:hypothetical protein